MAGAGDGKKKGRILVSVSRIPGKKARVSLPAGSKAADLLAAVGVNRETVVVRRGGRPIPESEPLSDKDAVEIISVISGG